jgi:hypothetical protein
VAINSRAFTIRRYCKCEGRSKTHAFSFLLTLPSSSKLLQNYLIGEVERNTAGEDHAERMRAANEMVEMLKVVVDIYATFAELMKNELDFCS